MLIIVFCKLCYIIKKLQIVFYILGINDATCQTSFLKMPSLHKLVSIDLSWSSLLSDHTVSLILGNCNTLQTATLTGLKRITSKPFIPIINNYNDWFETRREISERLQLQLGADCKKRLKDLSRYEVRCCSKRKLNFIIWLFHCENCDGNFFLPWRITKVNRQK